MVDVEQGEMIAVNVRELGLALIRAPLLFLRPNKALLN